MSKVKMAIMVSAGVLILIGFNWSIISKEKLLNRGQLVLLPLAPVDPRSLMQGDYMDLRYAIPHADIRTNNDEKAYCVFTMDSANVAIIRRVQSGAVPLQKGEHLLKCRIHEYRVTIGAESYFFQEGQAEHFAVARYGGLRVDEEGNALLDALYDTAGRKIQ